jgi:hypothetical protein
VGAALQVHKRGQTQAFALLVQNGHSSPIGFSTIHHEIGKSYSWTHNCNFLHQVCAHRRSVICCLGLPTSIQNLHTLIKARRLGQLREKVYKHAYMDMDMHVLFFDVHTFHKRALLSESETTAVMIGAPCSQLLFFQPSIIMQMDVNSLLVAITSWTASA